MSPKSETKKAAAPDAIRSAQEGDPSAQSIDLYVRIVESPTMDLSVTYQDLILGTQTRARLRPAHIAGLLSAAAHVILSDLYKKITPKGNGT